MANCNDYISADDLKTGKQAILHIEHVAKSRDTNGNHALDVTDTIRGQSVTNKTLDGLENLYNQAISQVGYITMDSFEGGATLTLPNQVLRYEATGEYYRWDGEFPKIVPAGSTPETTGGVGVGAWLSVGDASLRSELKDIDGFSIVGSANYSDIRSYTGSKKRIYVYGKSNVFDGGNGIFELDVNDTTSVDDGGTVLVSASGGRYKRISDGIAMLEWWEGANIDDPNSDCLSAWNKFANSDVYNKLKLRTGTYRFSDGITTVAGKQKDIEGQGFWKTILQIGGTGYGFQSFETITARRFQIRRVNASGVVEEPGFGSGIGSGFRAANSLSSSAYTRLEQVLVTGHFNIGFEINAVSGSYVNCNAYNVKGDGYLVSGGSNHFEKCWAEHNNVRAFTITGIGNQFFQCYEEQNGLADQSLSQVFIGPISGSGSGMDTRIEDFNFNPRNLQLNVPVFECNASSIYISAIEEVPVDPEKLVCNFSQYCTNSHYDGKGLISGGVIGGYPATYNQNKATVKGVSNIGGGLIPSNKGILIATQLINFNSVDQVFSGAPGGFIISNTNASIKESATAWNLAYPGSNLNIYTARISVLTPGLKLSLKFFNQGFESNALLTTNGDVKTFTLKGTGMAPFATGSTLTDTIFGLKLINNADSVASGTAFIEIEYCYS